MNTDWVSLYEKTNALLESLNVDIPFINHLVSVSLFQGESPMVHAPKD